MKIVIATHQGQLYNDEVDYVVIRNQEGEFSILRNHIPIVSIIIDGYVKLVLGKDQYYVVIINGIAEFKNNELNVLAQEAHIGRDAGSAKEHLIAIRKERLEENRRQTVDLTEKEKELRENIKKARAGRL